MRDSFISGVSPENLTALQEENCNLRKENDRLRMILKQHGIDDEPSFEAETAVKTPQIELVPTQITVSKKSSFEEKASLFLSLFHGRDDVYARQWQSKEARLGIVLLARMNGNAVFAESPSKSVLIVGMPSTSHTMRK